MQEKHYSSGKAYVTFSDEEISAVRNQDMASFIERQEGFSLKKVGSYTKGIEHDSLVIDPDHITWHWYSQDLYGKGAIDWMVKVHNFDFIDAVKYLADNSSSVFRENIYVKPQVQNQEPVAFCLPKKFDGSCKNLYAYLIKSRSLPSDIVTHCVENKLMYQDDKNRVVFCGYDKDGVCKFAEAKITNTYKKYYPQNIAGSSKHFSFYVQAKQGCANYNPQTICVFEAPIDALSHGALMQMVAKKQLENVGRGGEYRPDCWLAVNRVSLSGLSDLALEQRLNDNPQIKNIVLCLDNDEKGIQASQKLMDKYKDKYNVRISKPPYGKDWNETLQSITQKKTQLKVSKAKTNTLSPKI